MLVQKVEKVSSKNKVLKIAEQSEKTFQILNEKICLKNPAAADMPDIDYDVSDNSKVKEEIIKRWGNTSAVSISNWVTLQPRSLISDIAKFYGVPFKEVKAVTSVMEKEAAPKKKKKLGIKAGVLIGEDALNFDDLKMYSESLIAFLKKYPVIADHLNKLYGQVKSCGRHAGGLVVGEDLDKKMPLIRNGGVVQTPWSEGTNVRHLEPMGFIKFDLLALSTLRMIEDAIELILRRHYNIEEPTFDNISKFYQEKLHSNKLDFEDQKVYENVFHKGNWCGIFQFSENGMQNFAKQVKPRNLIDLTAITSIYRPGPLGANVHNDYVKARNTGKIKYKHHLLEPYLKETYGFCVFQEQIAQIACGLGKNISEDEGNKLRKILIKKGTGTAQNESDKIYDKFVEGCLEKGISTKIADEIWEDMYNFKQYGFNKCLTGDTEVIGILEDNGKVLTKTTIRTLWEEQRLKNLHEREFKPSGIKLLQMSEDGLIRPGEMKKVHYNGVHNVYELRTKKNRVIKLTKNHRLLSKNGYVCLQTNELRVGVKLFCLNEDSFISKRENISKIFESELDEVISIDLIGKEDVYDVEMATNEHNFVANGIVSHNSHALSYSIISFQTAWLLTYYPVEWVCAFMNQQGEAKKEQAINIANGLGFAVKPVSVDNSGIKWEPTEDGKSLVQPLNTLTGLGDAAMKKIIKNRPYSSVDQMLFDKEKKIGKKELDVLIRIGACDHLLDERFKHRKHMWLSCAYDKPSSNKKLLENIDKYKREEGFTEEEQIENLVALTGVFPFDLVVDRKSQIRVEKEFPNMCPISDYDGTKEYVWFIPRTKTVRKTQHGKTYWVLEVIDVKGRITRINCWGIKPDDDIKINRPYQASLEYDEKYGFSSRSIKRDFILIG